MSHFYLIIMIYSASIKGLKELPKHEDKNNR